MSHYYKKYFVITAADESGVAMGIGRSEAEAWSDANKWGFETGPESDTEACYEITKRSYYSIKAGNPDAVEYLKDATTEYIYELVDHTCEEVYFTGGVWSTLKDLTNELRDMEKPPNISGGFYDRDDGLDAVAVMKVYQRQLGGWDEQGKEVLTAQWVREYIEEQDEDVWHPVSFEPELDTVLVKVGEV
jgi:hypothetical protein